MPETVPSEPATEELSSVPEGFTRFTHGLVNDVFRTLETYGYVLDAADRDGATGRAITALLNLVETFEGVR